MVETPDIRLARIRRERERLTGVRVFDLNDLLTRLSPGGIEGSGRTFVDDFDFLNPTGVGGRTLSFAQTEAGARLAASLAQDVERFRGAERLKLEGILNSLALELLPPGDVETAMRHVRKGELVKSKLAFQAVLENLADASRNEERRKDLDLAEENQKRTLRQARSKITIDMLGKDLGRAILFALAGSGGGGE